MTDFRFEGPSQRIAQLRDWPPGRIAQLKVFVSHLQEAVNNSLAAQVFQGQRRKFSEFVPNIVPQDITTDVSYTEIRISFPPPRGLRKFLFYEMQVSRQENFSSFDQFQSPETFFKFSNFAPGETIFFRVRVVTTDGEVGPWSNTKEITTFRAQASATFDNRFRQFGVPRELATGDGSYITVFELDHTAIGGQAFYMLTFEYLAKASQFINISAGTEANLSWSDLEFRWLENDIQVGGAFKETLYDFRTPGSGSTITNLLKGTDRKGRTFEFQGPFKMKRTGSLIQKIHPISAGTLNIKLQVRQLGNTSHEGSWLGRLDGSETIAVFKAGAVLRFRNASVFEFIVDA